MVGKVVCLYGVEDARRKDLLAEIKKKYGIPPTSPDTSWYEAEKTSLDEIITIARTAPFLSPQRCVIIERIETWEKEQCALFVHYLHNPSPTTLCILVCSLSKVPTWLLDEKERIECIECNPFTSQQRIQWIQSLFAKQHKKITTTLVQLIIDSFGEDMYSLQGVVEQISLYAYTRNTIVLQDIEPFMRSISEYTGFELIEALETNNKQRLLLLVRNIAQDRGMSKRLYELIGLLGWHYKRLVAAKEVLSRSSETDMIRTLRIPSFFAKRFIGQVKAWSSSSLEKALTLLLEADVQLKTGLFEVQDIERFIFSLAQLQRPLQTGATRGIFSGQRSFYE